MHPQDTDDYTHTHTHTDGHVCRNSSDTAGFSAMKKKTDVQQKLDSSSHSSPSGKALQTHTCMCARAHTHIHTHREHKHLFELGVLVQHEATRQKKASHSIFTEDLNITLLLLFVNNYRLNNESSIKCLKEYFVFKK